jgi:hypothetical protein
MLSNNERARLAAILGISRIDEERGVKFSSEYSIEVVRWLALKLEEINNTLKELEEEVAKNLGLSEINCKHIWRFDGETDACELCGMRE